MLEFYHKQIPYTDLKLQARTLNFPGGGWVQFKTSEEPDGLRGESLHFIVVDEAAHIPKFKDIWELSLRPTLVDFQGAAWFISTPKGFNFFYELFLKGTGRDQAWKSFQFSSRDNNHIQSSELEELTKDLPALVKRQEIDAEFVQLAGALFKREWIETLESEPAGISWIRSWDLAFTEKTTSDFTAGAKVGMDAFGVIIISHIIHDRWEWPKAVAEVKRTVQQDGLLVRQGIEVVGAQVGFLQTLLSDPALAAVSINPIEVVRDKVTRALPLAARAEQGRLKIVRGEWNQKFLDELCAFPESDHDDMVDAVSGALTMMVTPTGAFNTDDINRIALAQKAQPRDPDVLQEQDLMVGEADLTL